MKKILVVDDNQINLEIIASSLTGIYEVYMVTSAKAAFNIISKQNIDLVLLDIMMPEIDGIEAVQKIKNNPKNKNLPIIFITADQSNSRELECLKLGAVDFIRKPVDANVLQRRVENVFLREQEKSRLEQLLQKKTSQIEILTQQSVEAIAVTIDAKDKFTKAHSMNVAKYAVAIANAIGWNEDDKKHLYYQALLHDIGNIGIPDEILNKQEPLTDEEFEIIKSHTSKGAEILTDVKLLKHAEDVARYHHERYDGTGYGEGLAGENIPISARIVCLAGAYDAMSTNRPYRKRLSGSLIKSELIDGRGTQFDPVLVDALINMLDENAELRTEYDCSLQINNTSLLQKVLISYTNDMKLAAGKDPLTGLFNRSYMEEKVNNFLDREGNYGTMMMLDLDNFKVMNDTYGHLFGDKLLIDTAQALKEIIPEDSLIARMGGDEFIIFLKNIRGQGLVEKTALDVIYKLNSMMEYPDGGHLSASIGIAFSGRSGDNFANLYSKSDKALYVVKANGKSLYHFYNDEISSNGKFNRNSEADLDFITNLIDMAGDSNECYIDKEELNKLYGFIFNNIKKENRSVHIILFTISDSERYNIELQQLLVAKALLNQITRKSLRKLDFYMDYSSTQMVVVILEKNTDIARMVAERITNDFKANINIKNVSVEYAIKKMVFDLDKVFDDEDN